MSNNQLVSVLIPAYNHEKYVQETIKSIINQTYQNIELIIIDDGSKDSTWNKIQEMKEICQKRFKNIFFETKNNEGTCITINKLLSHANGEYILIIASDDLVKQETIQTQVDFLSKNKDYAIVVGDNEIIDSENKTCYWDENNNIVYNKNLAKYTSFADFYKKNRKDINFNSNDFGSYSSLSIGNYIPNGYLIRKSIFEKTGYFTTEAPLEDYYLMLQIAKYAKFKYIDKIMASYRWHDSNTIKNTDKMLQFNQRTREYENKILLNIDDNIVFDEVLDAKHLGRCCRIQKFPFGFKILLYKNNNNKRKFIVKHHNNKLIQF